MWVPLILFFTLFCFKKFVSNSFKTIEISVISWQKIMYKLMFKHTLAPCVCGFIVS